MKAALLAVIRIIGGLFVFVGIVAGCMAALLLLIVVVRFPPLLIAVLLACWVFSRLQSAYRKTSE